MTSGTPLYSQAPLKPTETGIDLANRTLVREAVAEGRSISAEEIKALRRSNVNSASLDSHVQTTHPKISDSQQFRYAPQFQEITILQRMGEDIHRYRVSGNVYQDLGFVCTCDELVEKVEQRRKEIDTNIIDTPSPDEQPFEELLNNPSKLLHLEEYVNEEGIWKYNPKLCKQKQQSQEVKPANLRDFVVEGNILKFNPNRSKKQTQDIKPFSGPVYVLDEVDELFKKIIDL